MKETINELIQKYGQFAWDVAVRQVEVTASLLFAGAITSTIVLLGMIVCFVVAARRDSEPGVVLSTTLGLVSLTISIAVWIDYYRVSTNPAYYAIRYLLGE